MISLRSLNLTDDLEHSAVPYIPKLKRLSSVKLDDDVSVNRSNADHFLRKFKGVPSNQFSDLVELIFIVLIHFGSPTNRLGLI